MIFSRFLTILFFFSAVFASIENETCKTPNQKDGKCIRFKNCSPLFSLKQSLPFSNENKKLIRESQCGVLEDGKPLVCCPESTEADNLEQNNSCVTPNDEEGTCVVFKTCDSLFSIYNNKPVSPEDLTLIRESNCGKTEDNKPKVCCPASNSISSLLPVLDIDNSCLTPNNEEGTCKLFRTCDVLFSIFQSKPISVANLRLIKESKCGETEDSKPMVCCPSPKTTTTSTTTTEATTTQEVTTEFTAGKPCKNPNNNDGTCVRFRDCPKLFEIFNNKPISPINRELLRKSQCGFKDKSPYVCCVNQGGEEPTEEVMEETTTVTMESPLAWLETLKQKVPQAPHCGFDAQDRIFGGEETEIKEFPWTAILEYEKPNDKKGLHCGGSIINDRYILTAAHCVKKIPSTWKLINVRLGEWNTATDPDCDDDDLCAPPMIKNNVVETIVHSNYRKNGNNLHFDIALLRLAKQIEFNNFVQPICLPLDQTLWTKDYTGYTFDVTGWGKTENTGESGSSIKMKVALPFVSQKDCAKIYQGSTKIADTQICAGGVKGKDSCRGDSGGPLMILRSDSAPPYWYQVGLVSYGSKNCSLKDVPGVYTKISSTLQWISENIRN